MKKKSLALILFFIILGSASSFAQMRLSLQAGLKLPTGDFGDVAGTGWGLAGTFEYMQGTNPLSFTGSIGYNNWGANADLPAGEDYTITDVPIQIGVRYYLSHGDFHPYIGAEMGIHIMNSTLTLPGPGDASIEYTSSDTKFGLSPLIGFRYHISPTVDLDFNLKYDIVTTDPATNFIEINGGVQFGL